MKSWSEVVKRNTAQAQSNLITTTKHSVKKVMEKVNEEERRASNLMFYGLPEEESEEIGSVLAGVFESMSITPPKAIDGYRIGRKQEGKVRPIRLECKIRSDVDYALLHSKRLRNSDKHSRVYLAPDRTKEQREQHSSLVKKMRDLMNSEPTKHHFIRNDRVCSVDKQ